MNKADLINRITTSLKVSGTPISKTQVEAVLDMQAEVISSSLQKGDATVLPGLGKFSVTDRAERQGRNPQTGEAITIPAAKVPKFTAIKALKDAVNQ